MSTKIGDTVVYATGGVDREIHFVYGVVVDVSPEKRRVGIAIREVVTKDVAAHRDGDKIVTITTLETAWIPKYVAATSISPAPDFDPGWVPPQHRSEVAIPQAWEGKGGR